MSPLSEVRLPVRNCDTGFPWKAQHRMRLPVRKSCILLGDIMKTRMTNDLKIRQQDTSEDSEAGVGVIRSTLRVFC